MLVTDLVSLVRTLYLDDTVEPYLWSDDVLTTLALQAEVEACKRANLLINSSDYNITTTEGIDIYNLSSNIIKVVRAEVVVGNIVTEIVRKPLCETGYIKVKGSPLYYEYIDNNSVRVYPIPDKTYEIKLYASVLPTTTEMDEFQIPSQYHNNLGYYVAAKALLSADLDATDTTKARYFEELFDRSFGSAKDAKSLTREKYYSNDKQVLSSSKKFGFP